MERITSNFGTMIVIIIYRDICHPLGSIHFLFANLYNADMEIRYFFNSLANVPPQDHGDILINVIIS